MPNGTYAGVRFSSKTKENIKRIQRELKLQNPVDASKLHTTVCYSRKPVAKFEPIGNIDPSWKSTTGVYKLELWKSREGSNCLVLLYNCKPLEERHKQILAMGAEYDYDEYKPHITLSYDAPDVEYPKMVMFADKSKIEIVEEYYEPLDLEWASKLNERLIQRDGEWVLISRNAGRVLRKYGKDKPSEDEVAQDEAEIMYFKNKS